MTSYSRKNLGLLLISVLHIAACANMHDNTNSTLWIQTSAEFKANSLSVYNNAANNLDNAINDLNWLAALEQDEKCSHLSPAIILDIDETVLDNSRYQASLIEKNAKFDPQTWDDWIKSKSATAIPGAVSFIKQAKSKGAEVFLVTNRECKTRDDSKEMCPQELDTIQNLRAVGFLDANEETLLLKKERTEWTSEKKSRREHIAENYRIIMLVGDDLGDFIAEVKEDISVDDRDAIVERFKYYWGNKWYVIANPTYGSWHSILAQPVSQYLKRIE